MDSESSDIVHALSSAKNTRSLTKVICRSMSAHTFMPQALGTRASSLPHKASCVVSSIKFECTKSENMEQFLKAGVSGTFDLGTEYGLGDVARADFWSHFAENTRPSKIQQDDADHAEFPPDEEEEHGPFLFSSMLTVAALLHILDGVTKDLHHSLKDFDLCMTYLVAIMGLLCYEGPRQAFIHRCLRGGGFHDRVQFFERTFPLHSEHRWSSLIDTIRWLLPLQRALRETWNPDLSGRLQTRDGEFQRDMVTKAIHSTWFWCYLRMCGAVSTVLSSLQMLAEGCACHSERRVGKPKYHGRWRLAELQRRFKKLLGPLADDDHCTQLSFSDDTASSNAIASSRQCTNGPN